VGIAGNTPKDPTVYYEPYAQRWILIVVGADNSIWRSTFDKDGSYNNDWVRLAGNTPGTVAGAGKVWVPNAEAIFATDTLTLTGTTSNVLSRSWTADETGFVLVRAWGQIHVYHVNGTTTSVPYSLGSTSGGTDLMTGHVYISSTQETGYHCLPITIQRWIGVSANATVNAYFTASFSGAGNAYFTDRSMDIQYIYY
jgi:hypothetical protein